MKMTFVIAATMAVFSSAAVNSFGQVKYIDKNTEVSFFSHTPVEDIEAKNTSAVSVMDAESGAVEFSVLIKAFTFERALMQEHFNENYMESEKFPKATFKGTIKNIGDVNFKADGSYTVALAGTMTIHGVSKEMTAVGTIKVNGSAIEAVSTFVVKPEDYKIEIPGVVKDKIAKEMQVKVDADYTVYSN